jgi:hypothetical protein
VAGSSRIDVRLDQSVVRDIDQLSLAIAAGFDEKRINRALQAASLEVAKANVKPVRAEAVGSKGGNTGRLKRAIWAQPVMRDKPGAYVGIRGGSSRDDQKGAWYRYIITAGVSRVPYTISAKNASAPRLSWADVAAGIKLPDGNVRPSVVRRNRIPANPFVTRVVSRNMNTSIELFGRALASIIQRGIPARGRIKVKL